QEGVEARVLLGVADEGAVLHLPELHQAFPAVEVFAVEEGRGGVVFGADRAVRPRGQRNESGHESQDDTHGVLPKKHESGDQFCGTFPASAGACGCVGAGLVAGSAASVCPLLRLVEALVSGSPHSSSWRTAIAASRNCGSVNPSCSSFRKRAGNSRRRYSRASGGVTP